MRFAVKIPGSCLLIAVLASAALLTGCKTQNTTINNQDPYHQWEHDTNRPHEDLDKRSPAEQREYRDWQQSHNQYR